MKTIYPEGSRNDAKFFAETVVNRCKGNCEVCGLFCVWIGEIHHIKAVKDGGDGYPANLIHLCPNCHRTIEKIKTRACENPFFEEWLFTHNTAENAQRLINIAYGQFTVGGNQA